MPTSKSSSADLPDLNVWLALVSDRHVHHGAAREWFEALEEQRAVFCRVTQMGLLRLLTHPKVMGEDALSLAAAWQCYDALRGDARVVYHIEPPHLEARWRLLTTRRGEAYSCWTDAYLAAFAFEQGLRLVTFDRWFERQSGLDKLMLAS